MGSVPSGGPQKTCDVKVQENVTRLGEEVKTESILKEVNQNVEKVVQTLKPSQSVNLDKAKNQTKVKKVRDARSVQALKDVKIHNNENRPHLPDIFMDEIEDISVSKKIVRQLNPVAKKKMASDRVLISQQSKTQNVISMIPLGHLDTRNDLESRTKRYRVSRML